MEHGVEAGDLADVVADHVEQTPGDVRVVESLEMEDYWAEI